MTSTVVTVDRFQRELTVLLNDEECTIHASFLVEGKQFSVVEIQQGYICNDLKVIMF